MRTVGKPAEESMEGEMIELMDGYVVIVNDLDYALARRTNSIDKRSGRPIYDNIGYFGTLEAALERLVDIYTRNALKDGVYTLSETVATMNEVGDMVAKRLHEITEGK